MKAMVLDMMVALNEMVENGEIGQFDKLNEEMVKKIVERANEIAEEE